MFMIKRLDLNSTLFPLVCDFVLTDIALYLARQLRLTLDLGADLGPGSKWLRFDPLLYLLVPLIWVVIFALMSVYEDRRTRRAVDELRTTALAAGLATLVLVILVTLFWDLSRLLLLYFLILNLLVLSTWRLLLRFALRDQDDGRPCETRYTPTADTDGTRRGAGSGTQSSLGKSDWIMWGFLCLVLLLAAGLRFYELGGESLWGDEVIEASQAQQYLTAILSNKSSELRLLLTRFFMLVSKSEFFVRLPYALAGILGVGMAYSVGKTLFDSKTGLIVAFLLAISSFHIRYSQEARSYVYTVLLVLTTLYCLWRALQDNKLKHWVGFAVLTALSLNNYIVTASVSVSEVAWAALVLLWSRCSGAANPLADQAAKPSCSASERLGGHLWLHRVRSSRTAMLALSLLVAGTLFLPLGLFWLSGLRRIGVSAVDSDAGSALVSLSGDFFAKLLNQYGAGDGMALYLFNGAFVAGLLACVVQRQWRQIGLALVWLMLPFFIVPRISSTAYFGSRHLIFLLPMYLLLIARGVTGFIGLVMYLAGRLLGNRISIWCWGTSLILAVGIFGGLSVEPIQTYYREQKQDWRGVADLLREQTESGDIIFQPLVTFREAIPYYLDSYLVDENVKFIHLFTTKKIGEDDFPANIWGVLFISRGQLNKQTRGELESQLGPGFSIYPFFKFVVIQRQEPLTNLDDYSQVTTKLILIQSLFDHTILRRLDQYMTYAIQTYNISKQSGADKCAHESHSLIRYIKLADEQLERKHLWKALDSVRHALKLHDALYPLAEIPDASNIQPLLELGDSALAAGDIKCSFEFYSRAIDADMNNNAFVNVNGWQDPAEVLFKAEQYERVILAYQQAISLLLDRVGLKVRLAQTYLTSNQPAKAIAPLEQAISLSPSNLWPRWVLGGAYRSMGQMDQAISVYRQILEIAPNNPEAHFGLALVYDAQGLTTKAARELQTMLDVAPEHNLAQQAQQLLSKTEQLGDTNDPVQSVQELLANGLVEEAFDLAMQALEGEILNDKEKTALATNVGNQLVNMGETARAIELLNQVLPDTDNAHVWVILGKAYMSDGQAEKAIPAFEQALLLDPQHYWANHLLARLYAKQAEWEAVARLEQVALQVAASDENRVDSAVYLVEACENLGDLENACAILQQIEQWAKERDTRVEELRQRLDCQP
jgi:mannosyltransferase